jgi:hypothetical protein
MNKKPPRKSQRAERPIRWVSAKGDLPKGLDVSDRVKMHDWLRKNK